MKALVVYYSMTGKRRLVAQAITEARDATLLRLDCVRS
jgi:flavodoxin